MAWLVDKHGKLLALRTDGPTRIGRSFENDIVLTNETVSQRHAMIVLDNGRALLKDLESSNGTFIGGVKVAQLSAD